MSRFADRCVVVTGGGGALGSATCDAFARSGAHVVVADLNLEAAERTAARIRSEGARSTAIRADVATVSGAGEMVASALGATGRIDALVNIAGVQSKRRIEEIDLQHWNDTLQFNLTSTFLCIQAVVPVMSAAGGGRIVNMSSFAINSVPWFRQAGQGRSAYAAAKAGIVGLTRTLAGELAEMNINVNVVIPGPIREPHDTRAIEGLEANPLVRTPPLALIPKRRYGTADDVANAILFFASDEADYITGESLNIAGGL